MAIITSGPDRLELSTAFFSNRPVVISVADREVSPNHEAVLQVFVTIMDRDGMAGRDVKLSGYYTQKSGDIRNLDATYDPESGKGSVSFSS